jgi:O-antigen ligase|tara:strand:- start:3087 stop:4331 length:1245 start_codon:yes stop_codon:yes gene_type:complete
MTIINNTLSRLNLLRGLLLLSLFGMPGILHFDITGVTHQFGLFNIQSFSRIAVYLSIGMIVFLFFIGIEKLRVNRYTFSNFRLPFLYYSLAILISVPVLKGTDFILSGYFIFEWTTFFILFYLYVNEQNKYSLSMAIQDIILLIWIKIITLLIILPIFPSIGIFFDQNLGIIRLGGYFVGPNVLGTLVALLASYYYFYYKGPNYKKYGFFLFAILILFATNSRGALLSFILAFSFSLIGTKKGLNHLILFYFGGIIATLMVTYIDYLMRGLDISNLITLSERVPLWGKYAFEFPNSPIIGFGFIVGVKNLGLIIPKIHWVAPHAHNDLIQSIMSGGIIMGVLTFGIYVSLYRKCYKSPLTGNSQLLMKNWFIILIGYAMLTPIINWKLFAISGIFWILFITLRIENNNADLVRP